MKHEVSIIMDRESVQELGVAMEKAAETLADGLKELSRAILVGSLCFVVFKGRHMKAINRELVDIKKQLHGTRTLRLIKLKEAL